MTAKGCPCCQGKKTGEWVDLCDDCLAASLGGGCKVHQPDDSAPADDFERLAALGAPVKITVQPERHEHGTAWRWAEARAAAGFGVDCRDCRPSMPCWRHVSPGYVFEGYDDLAPALTSECVSGAAGEACTRVGGITITHNGGMTASCCEPCAVAKIGPVADEVPADSGGAPA